MIEQVLGIYNNEMTQTLKWRIAEDESGEESRGWALESLIYHNKEVGLHPVGFLAGE